MQANSPHMPLLPVLSLLLATCLWGVYWYPLRWLIGQGLDGPWIVLWVYLGTVIFIPFVVRRRWHELGRAPGLLIGIALASGLCNTLFILAVLEGNVVRVTLLFFLSPVWATLLARFFLNETLQHYSYYILALACAGALLILWKPALGIPWPESVTDWYGLVSGMAFAVSNVCIHKAEAVSSAVKTAVAWLGAIVIAAGIILLRTAPVILPSLAAIQAALLVGSIGMGIMTLSVTYGISHLPVHRSAVIMLFEVVVASVSTLALTHERPRDLEWLGGLLVVLAAYLAIRYRPLPKPAQPDTP
ncbi:MAG: DMT family transporter [Gammaproteobacteria bacterium]|nr:DMT family transporter [Gammaproteobacteria bacterium]